MIRLQKKFLLTVLLACVGWMTRLFVVCPRITGFVVNGLWSVKNKNLLFISLYHTKNRNWYWSLEWSNPSENLELYSSGSLWAFPTSSLQFSCQDWSFSCQYSILKPKGLYLLQTLFSVFHPLENKHGNDYCWPKIISKISGAG